MINEQTIRTAIAGFGTDIGGRITFATRTTCGSSAFMTNDSSTDAFESTNLYDALVEIYSDMPSSIKPYLLNVSKVYYSLLGPSYSGSGRKYFDYYLFPFSEKELFGTVRYGQGNEGNQYPLFNSNENRKADGGEYWTRSSDGDGIGYYVCYVTSQGADRSQYKHNYCGIVFGFCI